MDRHESAAGSSLEAAVRLIAASARHANDGVMVSAAAPNFTESAIVHVNPAFAALTGYDPAEMTGRPIHRLCVLAPERDRLERLSEALGRGENVFGLILTRAKDGSDLALEWRISALFGDGGARIAWIVHMNALHQRVSPGSLPPAHGDDPAPRGDDDAIETVDLDDVNRLFEAATVSSLVGVWDWKVETGEIYLSPNLKGLLGYDDHEIANHLDDWGHYVHPEDQAKVGAAVERLLNGRDGDDFEVEHRMVHRDGSDRWILARGRAIRDGQGQAVRVIGTDTDITTLRRADQQLRRHGEEISRLANAVPILLAYCDRDERFKLVNDAYEHWFARPTDEILGMTLRALFGERAYGGMAEAVARVRAGQAAQLDDRLAFKGAGRREVSLVLVPHLAPAGQVKGFYAAMQDISALRIAERALRVAKDDAERANRGKSRFLAAASHDLRQPLHALELLHAALSESPMPKEIRPIVSDMGDSLGAMGRILNALLDISELEAGAVTPRVEDFPVDHLLRRLESEYRHGAKEKGLTLRVVPSGAIIRSDPDLIERILGNFLSNAIRYTSHGRVLLGCRRRARSLRIDVLDRGPGIPPNEIDGLFEEFRQLDVAAASRDKGLGLGLAIAKRLAKLLGHEIHVASILGRGSLFALEVALGEAQEPERAQGLRPEPSGHDLAGAKVILIEDDLAVATATQRFLETWGCRVTTVASGGQALSALEGLERPPDLIIADYRLPEGRSGMEAIEQLQGDHIGGVPALIVTGDTSPESLETLSKCGYNVLHKPVRPAKLRALVSNLLSEPAAGPTPQTAAQTATRTATGR
jgi:PAS domain S-box-containing protein